jgi:hypothetical protein
MFHYGVFMTITAFKEFIARCKETWPENTDIQEIEKQMNEYKVHSSICIKYTLSGQIGFFNLCDEEVHKGHNIYHEVPVWDNPSGFSNLLKGMIEVVYNMSIW